MNTLNDFTLSDLVGDWTDYSKKMKVSVNANNSYYLEYDSNPYSGIITLYELEDIDYPDNISRQSRKIEFDGFDKEILLVQIVIYINKTDQIILNKN